MSKSVSELTTEILVAALMSQQLSIRKASSSLGAEDIAAAYKKIFSAVEAQSKQHKSSEQSA